GRHRPDEHRGLVERIAEGVRHANRHNHHGSRFDVHRLGAAPAPELGAGDREHLLVVAVDVLRRLRWPRLKDRLDEPELVAGMRTVLDDAQPNRTAECLLALTGPNHTNVHLYLTEN